MRVSIVGASGYTGGELLRLLANHPHVEIGQATSRTYAGRPVRRVHPHLRGSELPDFVKPEELIGSDLLVLAQPHGIAQHEIERYAQLATRIIDLSADFRLHSALTYEQWYKSEHASPDWLPRFIYGLPETQRAAIREAQYISGVGCNAVVTILALLPLVRNNLLAPESPIIAEIKTGSSEGGATGNPASHHPVRSGVVRSYAPFGHRHTAEVQEELRVSDIHMSLTAIEMVRGSLVTAHAFTQPGTTEKDLWRAYRATYKQGPFVRIVREQYGNYRRPEPKILAGSNFADVSFDLDAETGRVVAVCAIDNLMKGAAGTAVQCLNIMCGFEETTSLEFSGLHPV